MTVIVSIGVSFLFWPLGGAVTLRSVIPVVATGGAVTVIVSIGVSFPLWPLGGAVTLESVIPIVATGGAVTVDHH